MYLYKGYQITLEDLFDDLEETFHALYIEPETIEQAKNGDIVAMYELGQWEYSNQRYTEAMLWFKLPDVKNLAVAQASIGHLYDGGDGVVQDYHNALDWYLKAAKQHYETAFSEIGTLFYNGCGVPRDRHKAKEWFYKGVEYYTGNEPPDDKSNPRLTDTEKQKPVEDLIREAELFLVLGRLEKDKEQLSSDVKKVRETQTAMEKEIKRENERVSLLDAENKTLLDALQKERTEASKKISSLDERVRHLIELLHSQKMDTKDNKP